MIVSDDKAGELQTLADDAVKAYIEAQETYPAGYADQEARCFAHSADAAGEPYGYFGCSPWLSAILADGLVSIIPYMKGAFFYRAVEQQVGAAALDGALRAFSGAYVGRAATMQDMLDTIQAETGFDATTLAEGWLKSLGTP